MALGQAISAPLIKSVLAEPTWMSSGRARSFHYKGFPTFVKQESIVVESRSD
jgi:hypothetical protein